MALMVAIRSRVVHAPKGGGWRAVDGLRCVFGKRHLSRRPRLSRPPFFQDMLHGRLFDSRNVEFLRIDHLLQVLF